MEDRNAAEELRGLLAEEANARSAVGLDFSRPLLDLRKRVVFEPLHEDTKVPVKGTEGSAGYDVFAYLNDRDVKVYRAANGEEASLWAGHKGGMVALLPGETILVPTGFKARMPRGLEAQVRARSSWAIKRGLIVPNAPGTIDSDYPDEWLVALRNLSESIQFIQHEDRVAQIVFNSYEEVRFEFGEVGVSTDRTGGVGSTG